MKQTLSFDRANTLLDYDPLTGAFRWKIYRNSQALAGQPAGSLNVHGYVVIKVDGVFYLAHRLAWLMVYGSFPAEHLDHVNHKRADNRISNLRLACRQENAKNRTKSRNNTTGHTGVYQVPGGKWIGRISVQGRLVNLGTFSSLEDAVAARSTAKKQYSFHPNHGE